MDHLQKGVFRLVEADVWLEGLRNMWLFISSFMPLYHIII
uniref:Uncharacterized protein n=1 Tax=Anguilla anguilla TaxID=7936 RepID=A0A0E9VNT1_ANGAN